MLADKLHDFNTFAWIFSNVLVAYIAVMLVLFVIGYYVLFNPKATTAGKFVFRFALSLVGVIGLVFISLFVDPRMGSSWWTFPGDVYWWRPIVRLVAYSYVSFTITSLTALLVYRKWFPHKLTTVEDQNLVKPRSI